MQAAQKVLGSCLPPICPHRISRSKHNVVKADRRDSPVSKIDRHADAVDSHFAYRNLGCQEKCGRVTSASSTKACAISSASRQKGSGLVGNGTRCRELPEKGHRCTGSVAITSTLSQGRRPLAHPLSPTRPLEPGVRAELSRPDDVMMVMRCRSRPRRQAMSVLCPMRRSVCARIRFTLESRHQSRRR
jgi:hypothetical protein